MERLKREVPIWKRERYADGDEEWRDGHLPGTTEDEGPAGAGDSQPR